MLAPIESLVEKIGINYTVLFGELSTLADWTVRGFPTTFLFNQEGKIANKYIGFRDKKVFVKDIETALGEE